MGHPNSPPLQIDNPMFFFFLTQTELLKFFLLNIFELFSYFPFLLISVLNMVFPFYMYIPFLFPSSWPLWAWPKRGGTVMNCTGLCHMSHPSRFCDTF